MRFADIPGHYQVKQQLVASVHHDRIPHAQLILGDNGVGHLPLALAYISYIMCLDRGPEDSCGTCSACVKTHKYIHPDVHWSMPVIGVKDKLRKDVTSNDFLTPWRSLLLDNPYATMAHWMESIHSDSKQADINVKECLTIIQKLGLKTFESDYKILLMWMPEYLGKEGNRLLKLIEEPTDNTILLLVAENQQAILNTILSRCQVTYVHALHPADITDFLVEQKGVQPLDADRIARAADGNLYRAMGLLDADIVDYSSILLDWLRIAYKADPVAIRQWVDDFNNWSKSQQKFFLEYCILYFREYRMYLITRVPSVKLSGAEQTTLDKMQAIIDLDKAESLTILLSDAIEGVTRNLNMRIQMMSHTLTVSELLRSQEKVLTLYKI